MRSVALNWQLGHVIVDNKIILHSYNKFGPPPNQLTSALIETAERSLQELVGSPRRNRRRGSGRTA